MQRIELIRVRPSAQRVQRIEAHRHRLHVLRRVRDRSRSVRAVSSVRTVGGGSVHCRARRRCETPNRLALTSKGESRAAAAAGRHPSSQQRPHGIPRTVRRDRTGNNRRRATRARARRCPQLPAKSCRGGVAGRGRRVVRGATFIVHWTVDGASGHERRTRGNRRHGAASGCGAVSAAFRDSRSPAYGAFVERFLCFSFFFFHSYPSRTTKLARR